MKENIYPTFPAAAGPGIDLNEQVVRNRPATFFLRVNSNAMEGAGIHKGDMVVVDRSVEAQSGQIVIAVVDGEMLIRRLDLSGGQRRLLPATANLSPILLSGESFAIWGVVTFTIRSMA